MFTLIIYPYSLMPDAHAKEVIIRTSAFAHANTFFGESVLQVVVTDMNADDDATIEDITVDIDADPDSGSGGTVSVVVPETSDSSGRFEFFLAHEDAQAVSPADLDPSNSQGVEGDGLCVSDCAPFVTFGPSGDLVTDADLYEHTEFDITAESASISASYGETLSTLELDRSAYGSTSFVYVYVIDPDANLNPFEADEFVVNPGSGPNDDLISLNGGSIDDVITFRETGDSTARFEGRYRLGTSITVSSESMVITLFDKANYNATLAAAENDSDSTDSVSFTVGDSDPVVDVGGQQIVTWDPELSSNKGSYALGETVWITVTDPDANADPNVEETLQLLLTSGGREANIIAHETRVDNGVFEASFLLGANGFIFGTDIEVAGGGGISVIYTDKRPADYSQKLSSGENPEQDFSIEIDVAVGGATASITPLEATGSSGSAGPQRVGSPLTLSTSVERDGDAEQPYMVIIEVRNDDGITEFLSVIDATMTLNTDSTIQATWTPVASGDYELRTFVISNFDEGLVLSELVTSQTTIL